MVEKPISNTLAGAKALVDTAERHGTKLTINNTGNTNILFQNGKQCDKCKLPPVIRAYAGQIAEVILPLDQPVNYEVWDGKDTVEKKF